LRKRIDAYSVRLFTSVARCGSIQRAAAIEHIAPSALSRRLSALEHAFSAPLLIRSPRGVTLTEAGQLVFARAAQMDEALESLVHEVNLLGDEVCGAIRLTANMSSLIGFLPERLKHLLEQHPGVRVSLIEADTQDVIRACLDHRADIGIGVETPVPAGLKTWHFAHDPLQVVLPRRHPLTKVPTITFTQVLQYPVIGIHHGGALDQLLEKRARILHKHFAPQVSVSCFDAVCRMIEAGLGIAVIPQSAALAYAGTPRFVRRPLADAWAQRKLCLYTLVRRPQPRLIQAALDSLTHS